MRSHSPSKIFWLCSFVASSVVLTACGNVPPATGPSSIKQFNSVAGSVPPAINTGGGNTSSTPVSNPASAPLSMTVEGYGNHARHVCVPALSRLYVRVMPQANYDPLLPLDTTLVNAKNGQLLYDGSPAYYTKLRIRISIPGTTAAWDFLANTGSWSVAGDFSAYLGKGTAPVSIPDTGWLSTPEWDVTKKTIYGSNPNDAMCTYWESQLYGCTLSSSVRASEAATCNPGEQKLLITNVVSDYPCQNDVVGWCKGGSIQTVPDYQHWNVHLQIMTENTSSFL